MSPQIAFVVIIVFLWGGGMLFGMGLESWLNRRRIRKFIKKVFEESEKESEEIQGD